MYKIIVLASVLMLLGCGQDGNQENNANTKAQSQDNKAITVKKPSSPGDEQSKELKEESHGLKWKQDN